LQLSSLLDRLNKEERAELLRRRPARETIPVDNRDLAGILSRADHLRPVFYELTRFQISLLVWLEGQPEYSAGRADLLHLLDGRMPEDELERQLKDMRLWGLVDFMPGASGGFVASYPAVFVAMPAQRRKSFRYYLSQLSSETLRGVVTMLGIKVRSTLKEDRLRAATGVLADAINVRARIALLSPPARQLFDWCLQGGGVLSPWEAAMLPGMESLKEALSSYRPRRGSSVLDELIAAHLLFPTYANPYYESYADTYVIPLEVDSLLSGRLFFDDPVRLPPLVPAGEARDARLLLPVEVVRDLSHLRGFIASGQCEWRQDGMPYKRSLDRLGKSIDRNVEYLEHLFALGRMSGLLERESGRSKQTAKHDKAVQQSCGTIFRDILLAWRDEMPGGYIEVGTARARRRLLGFLAHGPVDTWLTIDSLGDCLRFLWPLVFSPGYSATSAEASIAEMFPLGLGSATADDGSVAVMTPSHLLPFLNAQDRRDDVPEILPWEEKGIALPDRTVVAPPNAHPDLLAALWQVADVESCQGASVFRVSRASIDRALNRGLSPQEVHALLEQSSAKPLPETVLRLIHDRQERYGRIKVGAAAAYVRVEDPALLDEIIGHGKLRRLRWQVIAPGVACSPDIDETELLKVLRGAGHLPVEDGWAVSRRGAPGPHVGVKRDALKLIK
jgi:hypothetical protein